MGFSLGSGVALQVAKTHPEVDSLVLVSPFQSLPDAARVHFPSFCVSILLWDEYDSETAIAGLSCPVLLVHGRSDSLVPFKQGEALSKFYKGEGLSFLPVAAAGHNDILLKNEVWLGISSFLKANR